MSSRGPLRKNYEEAVERHLDTLKSDPGMDEYGHRHERQCRVWGKRLNATGVPVVFFRGKMQNVRRLVWEHEKGEHAIIPTMLLSPHCATMGACVEPDHMRVRYRAYTRRELAVLFPDQCNCRQAERHEGTHLPSCPITVNAVNERNA